MTATLSFFCLCATCIGEGRIGLTASGEVPRPFVTLAAPRSVPLGTVVYVTSRRLGWRRHRCVVQDRMARSTERRWPGRWDLFIGPASEHNRARSYGVDKVIIEIERKPWKH